MKTNFISQIISEDFGITIDGWKLSPKMSKKDISTVTNLIYKYKIVVFKN